MKKKVLLIILLISLFANGCSFFEAGRIIGEIAFMPLEATVGVVGGIAEGFFGTEVNDDDDYTPSPRIISPPEPDYEEEKDYRRDQNGNIIW